MAFFVPVPDRDDVEEMATPVEPKEDDDEGLLVFGAVSVGLEQDGARDDEVDVWDEPGASTEAATFDVGALVVVTRDDEFSTEVRSAEDSFAFRVGLFFA